MLISPPQHSYDFLLSAELVGVSMLRFEALKSRTRNLQIIIGVANVKSRVTVLDGRCVIIAPFKVFVRWSPNLASVKSTANTQLALTLHS